ncbi:MAG: hypothetical protein M0R38_04335 [Bacteroidia bacterium]|nr:hypothetical protein [Bacteroidia bacterium]
MSNTSGNQNSFIAKYNSSGTCQWVRGFTSDDENRVYHIAADKQGNAFVSGRFSGKITFTNIEETAIGTHDAYLVKYNQTGAIVWYQLLTGKGETHCTKVSLDGNSNVYVGGYFSNYLKMGSDSSFALGETDLFVAKLDSTGLKNWLYHKGSDKSETLNGLVALLNGDCLL